MKARWLAVLALLLGIALITACDSKQTAVISLEESKIDGKTWSYTMEPENVLVPQQVRVSSGDQDTVNLHQWEFASVNPGTVKLSFTYGDHADCQDVPYMNYEYRVDENKTITVVGVSGTVLPGAFSQ